MYVKDGEVCVVLVRLLHQGGGLEVPGGTIGRGVTVIARWTLSIVGGVSGGAAVATHD